MKNILILGGTQFFGKRLVEKLLSEGKQVTIATRGRTPDPFGERVERLFVDREDEDTYISAFENRSWDIVYDQTCYSPLEVKNAAEALKGKIKRYIFTSSQAVYDFGSLRREEEFDPISFNYTSKTRKEYPGYEGYQEAKRAAESYLFNETDFEVVAVRFPIVVGKDDYTNRLKFHVEKIKNQLPICFSNIENRHGFILSHEAAEFLYQIGQSNYTGPINPGSKGDVSMKELVELIGKHANQTPVITTELTIENASPYAFPGSWSINTEKVEGLGYRFSNLHETLEDLINFYLEGR